MGIASLEFENQFWSQFWTDLGKFLQYCTCGGSWEICDFVLVYCSIIVTYDNKNHHIERIAAMTHGLHVSSLFTKLFEVGRIYLVD